MRPAFFRSVIYFTACLWSLSAAAQKCDGSLGAPVVNETFGIGKTYGVGPELPAGVTKLKYFADNCAGPDADIPQGEYTIATSMGATCKGGTWQAIPQDHTGETNGYFMIINAAEQPTVFYTENVSGSSLCPGATYFFGAWIMNILRALPQTKGFIEPNITFSIETSDGTVLKTINTGNIPATDEPAWIQYGALFTNPPNGPDLVVKLINNAPGGNGNDLALDDITFSPCGPLVQSGFTTLTDNTPKSNCPGDNINYTLVAQQTGYTNPGYLWQQNIGDGNGWTTIPGANTTSLPVSISNAVAGKYQYRIGVLSAAQSGSESCRIYSDPLIINVYPAPVVTATTPSTNTCVGEPLQLSANGGDTYLWSGPNGYTSTEDSPVVTYNADPGFDGDYTVTVTRNTCSTTVTTHVKIYPKATIGTLTDAAICAGDAVQLNVPYTNATKFKWSPASGLDHDDIANPVASPAVTTSYNVAVSNDGCPDVQPTARVTVTVYQRPEANAGAGFKMFEGQSVQLKGTAKGDSVYVYWTPASYLDNPNSLTPVTSATGDITYTLHVVSDVNCGESTSSVFVRVYKKLTIPNSITPNGDGLNDVWDIKNLYTYPNALVTVVNRNGQQVYQGNGYTKPWDGTYNSSPLPVGTYYYVIDLKDDLPKVSGWLLIVR